MMNIDDETLGAYADGELDPATAAAVAAAIAGDPDLARRLAELRALNERLRAAYATVLTEPVPERLVETAIRARSGPGAASRAAADESARVIDLSSRRRIAALGRGPRPRWAAIAASLALGLALGPLLYRALAPAPGDIAAGAYARGVLAAALASRLASDPLAADGVRIGLSFRSETGQFCRSFATSRPAAFNGLACHDGEGWRVQILEMRPASSEGGDRYAPAASAVSPAIRSAVETRIAGEPLNAEAERAARDAGWAAR